MIAFFIICFPILGVLSSIIAIISFIIYAICRPKNDETKKEDQKIGGISL